MNDLVFKGFASQLFQIFRWREKKITNFREILNNFALQNKPRTGKYSSSIEVTIPVVLALNGWFRLHTNISYVL